MSEGTEKKIIVDEDWKSQVERERQEAQQEPKQPAAPEGPADLRLPPPSLIYLASTLYYQASVSMGLFPNPATGKAEADLALAKHAIDTLAVLQEKTEGNRTPDESEAIEDLLHQLRMAFVQVGG